jgi:pimeloyl-ACP methyl ester carboxylesterase
MKKRVIIVIIAVLIVTPVVIYFGFPSLLYRADISATRRAAGLVKKSVQVDDHTIVYLEGGAGPAVLMLHGFTSEKDHWNRFSKFVTPKYRVIIPDLAGNGESSKIMTALYDIKSQARRIVRFSQVLKLEKFHIIGSSMGGFTAGVVAADAPDKVISLALFDNSGITPPKKSEVQLAFDRGENPLVVKTVEDYDRVMKINFYRPLRIPRPVKKMLAEKAMANAPFNDKINKDRLAHPLSLEPMLGLIKAPVLVVWGEDDRVLDKSAAAVLQKGLPRSKVVIMKECGHLPMLERPEETAKHYLEFLQALPAR